MKKIIEFILDGCWHRWELVKVVELEVIYDVSGDKVDGKRAWYKCTKCSKLKKVDIY